MSDRQSDVQVDFLFRGSHPAFFWAAAMLREKGQKVALFPYPDAHAWESFPSEVLNQLDLHIFRTNRDQNPIQILTRERRLGIFNDLTTTQKDFAFCTGDAVSPELKRGLSFYAKGSDYPAVFGETSAALIEACHRMEYFEESPAVIKKHALLHLNKIGVEIVKDESHFPLAEQTIILDLNRACVFRSKFEISVTAALPTGGSQRMLYVERNAPVIELLHKKESLRLRTLLPETPGIVDFPLAEQTIILDLNRACVFRSKFEISVTAALPTGGSQRMLYVERNAPVIELLHKKESLRLRTLLPETPGIVDRMLLAIQPIFPDADWSASDVKVTPQSAESYEWGEAKSNVDSSKPGIWLISPALNPELGERSLYVRISDLLAKKFKKQQLFEVKDLFVS